MTNLFDDLEREARERSENLERDGRLPPGFTAKHYPMSPADHADLRRHKVALLLAEDADTFTGIVHGGKVPRSWYKRRLTELLRR